MLKMKMFTICFVAVLVMSASVTNAGSMAVTFPSTSGWTVSGTAGAPGYAQAHWVNTNSWQSSWGNQYSLVDNSGTATGATMDWYASGIYSWTFGAAANDDERMMDCGIASGGDGLVEIHAINIPYASYDVVVYFSSQLVYPFVSKYTIGSTSVYAQVPAMGYFGNDDTYVEVPLTSTADLQANTPAGNYIVFKNITGSTLYITAQGGWAGNSIYSYQPGDPRASISGFQIVEVPEPATIALLGIGGLLSVLKRRHR
jgi:hypothetical protein